MDVITVNEVTKEYHGHKALNRVSISVNAGDFFGLFGPNGAGKTTLLKILTGQILPTSGKVYVDNIDVVKFPMKVKRIVGIVPEVESPPSYLTAREYLYFVSKVREVGNIDSRIKRWLEFFGMEDSEGKICRDLSKGERQKLMLASALIHDPKILFLDEPFINLDPIYQRKTKDYLLGYVDGGRTIFMCSHLLDIAEKLCDKVAIINNGRILASGGLDQVRENNEDLESAFLRITGARR